MSKWACIIPTNRPEEFVKFYTAWQPIFDKHEVKVVVMVDLPEVPQAIAELPINILCWKDLTTNYVPTKTDMVRSFAFHWAYETFPEVKYFCTLDDDVRPGVTDIFDEYEVVFAEGTVLSEYFDVGQLTTFNQQMRGFPYKDRKKVPVAVQYGGWSGVLDYDAATQISQQPPKHYFLPMNITLPKGAACTCCIMNCAWQREYTPIMWQLPMLDGRYNRVGDIWSGLLIKKTLDSIGAAMVINGRAGVMHERASDVYNSLQKEAISVKLNDNLWEALNEPIPSDCGPHFQIAYWWFTEAAAEFFVKHDKEYAKHFSDARDEWMGLFE